MRVDYWTKLIQDIHKCKKCPLHKERTRPVPGEGSRKTKLMFIGEGPGENEDRVGKPFIGRSGKILTELIESIGITRDQVYITNIVKCRPPGNRNPTSQEINACADFLLHQVALIDPDVICTLGSFATKTILATDDAIGKLRGKVHIRGELVIIPTYHPSYILRNGGKPMPTVKGDFQLIKQVLNGKISN